MIYDADLRRLFKRGARDSIHASFWPTMGASLLELLPIMLITMIYNRSLPATANVDNWQMMTDLLAVFGGASLLYLLARFLVVIPIHFGAMHYYTYRARGQEASPSLVFGCFGDGKAYLNALKIALSIFVRSLGWIVLEAAAIIATVCFLLMAALDSAMFTFVMTLMLLVLVALSAVVSVKIRRYDGAYIRLIDRPEMSAWEATGACADTFRGHNWELFIFDLSFFLWDMGVALTVGLLGIYVDAYENMSFVNYFDALREHETGESQRPETTEQTFQPEDDLPPL